MAAQKTVENLFGGLTLIADQPVRVGDFCRFGDRVGTVEDIGLRSTRIRTLDRTGFAFPSRTMYLARDHGLDPQRREAAEHQVEQWRRQKALGLPLFPPEQLARLADTLDYPPRGSAIA